MPGHGRATAAVREAVAGAARRVGLDRRDTVLMALSGGPDSVALTYALTELRRHLRFRLVLAHFNHRARAEADREEEFVRTLAANLGLDLVVSRAANLDAHGPNFEERARLARHDFLQRAADDAQADLVALAHHADDQAETVLMRLLRGSGAHGLAAMAERGPGKLWRPLLSVSRPAITGYLRAIAAPFIEDASNRSPRHLRNRLRRDLLPLLERDYAPGLTRRLVELAAEMRAVDDYLRQAARVELERRLHARTLDLRGLAQLPAALGGAVLREFIRIELPDLGAVTRDRVAAAMLMCPGRQPSAHIAVPGGRQLRRDYDYALIEPQSRSCRTSGFAVALNLDGPTRVLAAHCTFEARQLSASFWPHALQVGPMEALFDLASLRPPLIVRSAGPGDRLELLGLKGSRKLHDLFVDRKVPRMQRITWPVVAMDDKIVWVPGVARSRFALVSAATARVAHVRAFMPDHG